MFTRFHIDANCTLDTCYTSFRQRYVEDSGCKICNAVQFVDHVLLTTNRIILENKLCKYVPNYHSLSDEVKLQIVLNFQTLWKKVKVRQHRSMGD